MELGNCTDILGIDCGTSNLAAYFISSIDGNMRKLEFEAGKYTCPSVVMYGITEGEVVVGSGAYNNIGKGIPGIITSGKRVIGHPFSSVIVQNLKDKCTSPIVSKQGKPVFLVSDTRSVTPIEYYTQLIKHIVSVAKQKQQSGFTRCVIGAPVYFGNNQRSDIQAAVESAGLDVMSVIDEPSSAALAYAYALDEKFTGKCLVYDLGGGTFDATIVECSENKFDCIDKAGDDQLGGDDFDEDIFRDVSNEYSEKYSIELFENETRLATRKKKIDSLRKRCRVAKERLGSCSTKEPIRLYEDGEWADDDDDASFEYVLSRVRLDRLLHKKIQSTIDICQQLMKKVNITPNDIQRVLLVGGSTQLPSIVDMLSRLFGRPKIVQASPSYDPMTIVAYGAIIKGIYIEREQHPPPPPKPQRQQQQQSPPLLPPQEPQSERQQQSTPLLPPQEPQRQTSTSSSRVDSPMHVSDSEEEDHDHDDERMRGKSFPFGPMRRTSASAQSRYSSGASSRASSRASSGASARPTGQNDQFFHKLSCIPAVITNVLSSSLGIEITDHATKNQILEILIPRGTKLPGVTSKGFMIPRDALGTRVNVYAGEFIHDVSKNRILGSIQVNGFPSNHPLIPLTVRMEMDMSELLHVSIEATYEGVSQCIVARERFDTTHAPLDGNFPVRTYSFRMEEVRRKMMNEDEPRIERRSVGSSGQVRAETNRVSPELRQAELEFC